MARVALVTGGTRGIGAAISKALKAAGYKVAASYAGNDAAADKFKAETGIPVYKWDVASFDACAAGVKQVEADLGPVDVLVNNAGVGIVKPFVELTLEEWHRMIDVNVNALYHVTRAVLPGMLTRRSGHVCTIGSIGGRSVFAGGTCYGATKAFVTSWAENLMIEVRDQGVKVSVVMPGAVATEFGGKQPSETDVWKLRPEDVADAVAKVVLTPPNVLIHRLEVRTLTVPAKGQGK